MPLLVNNSTIARKKDEDDKELKRQERRLTRAIAEIEGEISALDEDIVVSPR